MKASIVIINYNDKARVGRAIQSALSQTWQDTEVIVVDDGSDQETRTIYTSFVDKVKLVQLERTDKTARTPSRARNAGIAVAKGGYICFLDSDNYYKPEFIQKLIQYDADFAFSNWEIIGRRQEVIRIEDVYRQELKLIQNYLEFQHLDHQAVLFRRAYLDKIGYYDERLPRSQDCDLMARCLLGQGKAAHERDVLFVFEHHEEDQNKFMASIYGKCLWTLKNNINFAWMIPKFKNDFRILQCFISAVRDFTQSNAWRADYEKSDYRKMVEMIDAARKVEQGEK